MKANISFVCQVTEGGIHPAWPVYCWSLRGEGWGLQKEDVTPSTGHHMPVEPPVPKVGSWVHLKYPKRLMEAHSLPHGAASHPQIGVTASSPDQEGNLEDKFTKGYEVFTYSHNEAIQVPLLGKEL